MEVAKAVNRIAGRWRLTSSLDLNRRFPAATRAARWQIMQEALGIPLPQLERSDRRVSLSKSHGNATSIRSMTYWIARRHPERLEWIPVNCEPRGKMATHQWSDEEVWAVLRECICAALGVKPEDVTYDARTVEDLGME